jgi:hypothetical protein
MPVVPINEETKAVLERISQEKGISLEEATKQAVEMYWCRERLEAANVAYAKLRMNPESSRGFDDETKLWDGTLADGLE